MKKAGIIMILGSLLLFLLFKLPLWNITLGAPQYPDPLGLNIYMNGLEGIKEFDIQNIDGLNHYIGMKTLPQKGEMWEFDYFPIIVGALALLGIVIGLLGFVGRISPKWFLIWFIIGAILGILGMFDFYVWLNDYGSNLDPHAIIKVQDELGNPLSYSPPVFGHKKLLNFDVYSYPMMGAGALALSFLCALIAYFVGRKEWKLIS